MSQPPQQQQPYQGRGGGRGGYQPAPYGPGRGVARPAMGAWQPAQPSTGLPPPQQQQPPPQQAPYGGRGGGRGGYQPGGRGNYNAGGRGNYNPGRGGYQQPQQPPQQAQAYYNPYQQPQPPYGGRGAGGWQQQASFTPAPYGGGGRGGGGGVYYPPQQQQQQQPAPPAANGTGAPAVPAVVVPKPRPKKVLVITDKDGNVIDLSAIGKKKEQPPTPVTPPTPPSDAGAKMRQAALAKIQEKDDAEKTQKEEALAQKKEAGEQEAARKKKADEEAKADAAAKVQEKAEAAKVQEEVEAKKAAAKEAAPAPVAKPKPSTSGRIVLTKELLLSYKEHPSCQERPESLPDMTIVKGPARGTSGGGAGGGGGRGGGGGGGRRESYREGGGGGGGGDWSRGSAPPRRQSSQGDNKQGGGGGGGGGGSSWARGVAPPKPKPDNNQRNHRGGRGGHGQNQPPLYDGPVAPLAMSDNRWRPQKSSSAMLVAEKMVKSILNKMTKEKFDRLSQQMVDVPILSYAMLTMMIENVYDKAIDEPTFGDMYGDLCLRLSQSVGAQNFLHIVESDEEPPTEDGESAGVGESSHNTVYRWSNDISTTDSDIVGPFGSVQDCIDAALDRETDASPVERGEMELVLEKACIKQGMFMKILKKKEPEADDDKVFYVVYFEVSDAEECDQQLSEIFLSDVEAKSDATKTNSFKRSLLNKCEEEFNKQDIYVDWKKEKKEYEENKSTMTAPAIKEKEDDLNFRRIRIKKQMLGNVKFIGQLFKKKLLKEKVMRYCIASLLKLDEIDEKKGKNPEYKDAGDFSMDEEDHEAICSMFATIGSTIDTGAAASFMKVCFGKIDKMSKDQSMPSRSRFMYKDLIELRQNRWIPRRKEEKALTLDEIRKEVEREERKQAQESAQNHGHGGYNQRGRGGDQRFDNRNDNRNQRQQSFGSGRPRQPKPVVETDADGFTVIASARGGAPPVATKGSGSKQPPAPASSKQPVKKSSAPSKPAATAAEPSKSSGPAPLSEDKLKRRIKSMRSEFIGDGGNVDELILTFEELTGTPDYAVSLIQMNADDIMECKEDDRQAIIKIVTILAEKKKVTSEDIKKGLADTIEFIDSFVVDSPRAFEYLGQLLASLLRIGTIEVDWVCTASESTKADPNTKAPSRIVGETLKALSAAAGKDTAESKFNASQESLAKLLGGADQWNAIKVEYLG